MRSITSAGATEVRNDFFEEVVHSAYWNSGILVCMDYELLPNLLSPAFLFSVVKWDLKPSWVLISFLSLTVQI